jgi:predicted component of type VI protein secretion system
MLLSGEMGPARTRERLHHRHPGSSRHGRCLGQIEHDTSNTPEAFATLAARNTSNPTTTDSPEAFARLAARNTSNPTTTDSPEAFARLAARNTSNPTTSHTPKALDTLAVAERDTLAALG